MTPGDLRAISSVCGLVLLIWELIHGRIAGAFLSAVATSFLLLVSSTAGSFVAMAMVVPVVFEERWNPPARKDLLRGVLAGAVIASTVAGLVIYS